MAEGSLDTLGEERKGSFDEGKGDFDEGKMLARKAHECPVPKPGGVIGEVLGFRREDRDAAPGRTTRVETVKRGSDDR